MASKRQWDGLVSKWRRQLHAFDPSDDEDEEDLLAALGEPDAGADASASAVDLAQHEDVAVIKARSIGVDTVVDAGSAATGDGRGACSMESSEAGAARAPEDDLLGADIDVDIFEDDADELGW